MVTGRTIHLSPDFQVDGIHAIHDGSGEVWYAVQQIDRSKPDNPKYCAIYHETTPGVLTLVDRIDKMIGAPHIAIRPDGSAYVIGGGRNRTIETGYSLLGFAPLITMQDIMLHLATMTARIAQLEATVTALTGDTPQ